MKSIRCDFCLGSWLVEDRDVERQNMCPFCAAAIRQKVSFKEFNTLGKLLYGAVSDRGMEILDKHEQLTGWMLDMAASLSTEIRIFSKNINQKYMGYIKEAFTGDETAVSMAEKRIYLSLVENEGLSESWAELISCAVKDAAHYLKGQGISKLVNAQVEDFDMGIKWLSKASGQGSSQAKDILRKAYNQVTSVYWLMNSPETEKMLMEYKDDAFAIVELESIQFEHLDKLAKHFSELLNAPRLMVATKNFKMNGKRVRDTWACVAYFGEESDGSKLLKNGYEKKVKKGKTTGTYTILVKDADFESYKNEIMKQAG